MSIAMIGLSPPAVCLDFSRFTEKQETTPQKFSPRVQALAVCNPVLWPSNSTTSPGPGRGVGRTFELPSGTTMPRLARGTFRDLGSVQPFVRAMRTRRHLGRRVSFPGCSPHDPGYNDVHVLRGCGRRAETNPRGSTRDQRTSRMNRAVPRIDTAPLQ